MPFCWKFLAPALPLRPLGRVSKGCGLEFWTRSAGIALQPGVAGTASGPGLLALSPHKPDTGYGGKGLWGCGARGCFQDPATWLFQLDQIRRKTEKGLCLPLLLPVSAVLGEAGMRPGEIIYVTVAGSPPTPRTPCPFWVFSDISCGLWPSSLPPSTVRTFHTNLTREYWAVLLTDVFVFNC